MASSSGLKMVPTASEVRHRARTRTLAGGRVAALLLLLGSLATMSAVARFVGMADALSSGVMPSAPEDVPYVEHPYFALLHIIPGVLFLLIGPLQFMPGIRQRWPASHRILGRIFVLSGLIVGATAIIGNAVLPPIGGPLKSAAVYLFSAAQIVALILAVRAILRRDVPRHRAWMIRSFAIGLGISTMRLYFVPVYFLFGIPSDLNIGVGMWVGFLVNVIAAELILLRERRSARRPSASPTTRLREAEESFAMLRNEPVILRDPPLNTRARIRRKFPTLFRFESDFDESVDLVRHRTILPVVIARRP